ncbi:MAG TPA: zinc-binding dehydrogenase [Opitutaceae bacterium]|nr:zinc-binding dehydrogenase [Opitutaceae bacterium]
MKAVVVTGEKVLEVQEIASPKPTPREVVVQIKAAALNHRDEWIRIGQYAGIKYPCFPGSDGAGVIVGRGAEVDSAWLNREVIINPSFGWGTNPHVQADGFTILGLPRAGTLAEEIAVPVEQVAQKPAHLSWEEAAALPLAGLTAYRALFTRANLRAGEKVLISGIGGGVAVFALQFARAVGAEVWVTSSSPEKIAQARTLGAAGGFNYNDAGWAKTAASTAGPFDVIVDSAGGPGFESLIDTVAPGGRVVFYGATRGNAQSIPLRKIFWRQLTLLGTTMGGPQDWTGLVQFVEQHRIKPIVSEVVPLARAAEAFALMERAGQFGKIVLKP